MTTPEAADPPACTACGVCCFSTLPEYVRVFGVDFDRMSDRAQAFTTFDGRRAHMVFEHGHCKALIVDPDSPLAFTCAIYEERPDVCRSLARGSGACRADRHEKAERGNVEIARLITLRTRPA